MFWTVMLILLTCAFGGWKAARVWVIAFVVLVICILLLIVKNQCYTGKRSIYPQDEWVGVCQVITTEVR